MSPFLGELLLKIQTQQKSMISEGQVSEQSLISRIWETIVLLMVAFFVKSIIEGLCDNYLVIHCNKEDKEKP